MSGRVIFLTCDATTDSKELASRIVCQAKLPFMLINGNKGKNDARARENGRKAESKSPVTSAPVILALEASGNAASAAVLIDGKIAGMAEHKARHGHAETLILLAEKAISAADCPLSDITHIAAGCGPGSFTGLRVCLSAAKGYMLAIGASR